MQYTKDGNLHRISRITGPTHNFLAIEFGGATDSDCAIERLGHLIPQRDQLTDNEIKTWVLTAVANANSEFGSSLIVRRIQYVPDDTRNPNTYAALSRELVRRVMQEQAS